MLTIQHHLPIKFKCNQCQTVSFHVFQRQVRAYPNCIQCQTPVQLLGYLAAQDVTKYPLQCAKALLKNPLQRLST